MKITIRQLRQMIKEAVDPSGKEIIAFYPGRFQPMGRHHKATYDWMVTQFGPENSFVVTSDKVCMPNSPLCFEDKKQIAAAMGIPESSIIKEKIVYAPASFSVMQGKNPEDYAIVVVVGEKDMKPSFDPKTGNVEKPRFVKGKSLDGFKADGSPKYFKSYVSGEPLEGFDKHGYVVVAPHQEIDLGGREMSGSSLRGYLPTATDKDYEEMLGITDQATIEMMRKKIRGY